MNWLGEQIRHAVKFAVLTDRRPPCNQAKPDALTTAPAKAVEYAGQISV